MRNLRGRPRHACRSHDFMLTCGEAFVDQGPQRYEQQQRERSVAALKRRAAALGFEINPLGTAA